MADAQQLSNGETPVPLHFPGDSGFPPGYFFPIADRRNMGTSRIKTFILTWAMAVFWAMCAAAEVPRQP